MEQIAMNVTHAFARSVGGKIRNALFVHSPLYGRKEEGEDLGDCDTNAVNFDLIPICLWFQQSLTLL